jgi:hypothetical protein
MASQAITNMLNNPDILSDPTFLALAGAATLVVIAGASCLLQGKKPAPPPPKVEEAPAKDKGKAKVAPQKKGKPEKVKSEKKIISVDHPLWISSSSSGGEISGFAYNVFFYIYVISSFTSHHYLGPRYLCDYFR